MIRPTTRARPASLSLARASEKTMAPQERTIRYLIVDNVLADVPDAAPEVDAVVQSPADVLAALARVGVAANAQSAYLHTLRPGTKNEWRWQPLAAVSQLPAPPAPLVVKVLRGGAGGAAAVAAAAGAGAVAGGAAAVAVSQQPQQQQSGGGGGGGPFGIGRLLRGVGRIVTGGRIGGGGGGRPTAMAATHAGNTRWMDDRWREEEMMRERLEQQQQEENDDARERERIDDMMMGPDRDGDGVPDAVEEQQMQQEEGGNYGSFEQDNDGDNGNDDNGNDDDGGGFDGGDDDGGGFGDDD